MIRVTDRAAKALWTILRATGARDGYCLRLDLARGNLSLDRERPGDEVVRCGGEKVLTLDAYSSELWGTRELDCNEQALFLVDAW